MSAARLQLETLALTAAASNGVEHTDAIATLQLAFKYMFKADEYAPMRTELMEVAKGTKAASNSSSGGGGSSSSSSSSASASDMAAQ